MEKVSRRFAMDAVNVASDIGREALQLTLLLALPMLLAGLMVGVTVSILQAATQVQEQTLSFIPKIIAMFAALYFFMPMLITMIVEYAKNAFQAIAEIPF